MKLEGDENRCRRRVGSFAPDGAEDMRIRPAKASLRTNAKMIVDFPCYD